MGLCVEKHVQAAFQGMQKRRRLCIQLDQTIGSVFLLILSNRVTQRNIKIHVLENIVAEEIDLSSKAFSRTVNIQYQLVAKVHSFFELTVVSLKD